MARYIDADALISVLNAKADMANTDAKPLFLSVAGMVSKLPTADVVPKSEEGAECPTCHGTGRIGTTNWLTKNMTKKQIAEKKAKAIAEHEQHIKAEVAREIFEEIEEIAMHGVTSFGLCLMSMGEAAFAELKKKYTENENG